MAQAYHHAGLAERPSTFSLYVRQPPPDRGYLVVAGLDDCLAWLEDLRFGPLELDALRRVGQFSAGFLDWLAGLHFTGGVRAVPEGTPVFAGEPILEVDAPVVEGQLAETYLLNQVSLQTGLATAAARLRQAAGDRAVVDFGLRRAPGIDAGLKLARAARIVGLDGTSNVAGALRYGVPASGTMAHSYVQAYRDEAQAFVDFARASNQPAVLLVDTYDTATGIERAVWAATELRADGVEVRGVRIDSGDLAVLSRQARRAFDAAGFPDARVFVSGGLDEQAIAQLVASGAPIDGFGVGSTLASPHSPGLDAVYKLAVFDGRPVRKTSAGKATWAGAKQVWRSEDRDGDVLGLADEPAPSPDHRPLLRPVMVAGRRTEAGRAGLDEIHERFQREWGELPLRYRHLAGAAVYTVVPTERLQATAREVDGIRDRDDARDRDGDGHDGDGHDSRAGGSQPGGSVAARPIAEPPGGGRDGTGLSSPGP